MTKRKITDALMVVAVLVMAMALFVEMVKIWAGHPAEQTITEAEHMEMIEGWTR